MPCNALKCLLVSPKAITRHYTRILSLWPKDALRPNLPFTRAIEHHALPYGVKPLSPSPASAKSTTSPHAHVPSPSNPQTELANINALYSLLENRYSKAHPISPGVLKPTSNLEHYDRLMEEIEAAPGKSWLKAKLD